VPLPVASEHLLQLQENTRRKNAFNLQVLSEQERRTGTDDGKCNAIRNQQAETTVVLRANKAEMLRRKLPRKIGNAKNGCLKC
jgi:hypothetical protein